MNDDDATLEIGYSPDQIMKDARGNVGFDYSYRILKSEQYTKLKARIKDGVAETEQAPEIHMPQIAWFYNQTRDAYFRQGKIRVIIGPDGMASGLVGGYRDWRDLYAQNVFAQDGGQQGVREHEDHVALYYALRRHADGMFNAKTGRYDGISSAYRMKLIPALVVDPDKPMVIPVRDGDLRRRKAFDDTTAAMINAADTLVPQDVPPGSGENAVGRGGVPLRRGAGGSVFLRIRRGMMTRIRTSKLGAIRPRFRILSAYTLSESGRAALERGNRSLLALPTIRSRS